MAPDFRRQRSGERDDTSRPVLITGARESYRDELAARKKRYFVLMSVRIPALLLAAGSLALWNNPWIALAIVAGSIPIPWIAVIGANDRPPLPKGQARTYTAGSLPSNAPYALPSSLTGAANGSRPDSDTGGGRAIGPPPGAAGRGGDPRDRTAGGPDSPGADDRTDPGPDSPGSGSPRSHPTPDESDSDQ
ncbi:DUF3099 domain-containing protein [Dietzia cinnamea]|uniref:DUF3099 domain-containing protein n=1 Tax=Dietzia cinnamea TaxID=321318 RepID=UPI00223BDCC3|nr:DUF3099 domain-containing protein [Dietzia cinnamea]MCT2222024.1 DUF3099 domain-containing protein [Dietzia cinnamea]